MKALIQRGQFIALAYKAGVLNGDYIESRGAAQSQYHTRLCFPAQAALSPATKDQCSLTYRSIIMTKDECENICRVLFYIGKAPDCQISFYPDGKQHEFNKVTLG